MIVIAKGVGELSRDLECSLACGRYKSTYGPIFSVTRLLQLAPCTSGDSDFFVTHVLKYDLLWETLVMWELGNPKRTHREPELRLGRL